MLKIKKAEINDINNIIKLKDKIWCDLENKNWYFVEELTYEKLKEIIEKRGFILKTIVTDELVGYLIAVTNLHKNFELINLINKKINLKECAEISLAVEVNNRNKGIASEMLKTAEKYLTDKKYIL
ncbi:MAG: GNAT family N-acetyltransferase, partial [Bacilli bacterium]|nr:GNAT family N-acetyltransferase [Bacilli bacterium]